MPEVWLHHAPFVWYATSDGCSLVEKRQYIMLSDVRFVIDPIGQEGARRRQKPSTHAWAVGTPIFGIMEQFQERDDAAMSWLPLRYRWHADLEFQTIAGEATTHPEWCAIRGAKYFTAHLDDAGEGITSIVRPVRGNAERRRVQQYGFEGKPDG